MGRAKIGGEMNSARKGLNADVVIDNQKINKYEVFSLEFKENYVQQLKTMKGRSYVKGQTQHSPTLYRAELDIKDKPRDTFLRFDNWKKGVVFINNFNIGRYWSIGPQKTLYLPAPLLKTGSNDIFVYYRIGPYMCGEWELERYPAWLLKDPNMRLRSNYKLHLEATAKYFHQVLSIINEFQFTKGGPIIALQYENEYGGINNNNDLEYFNFMKDIIDKSGFKELLANCDSGGNAARAAPHVQKGNSVLETVNGNSDMLSTLAALKKSST